MTPPPASDGVLTTELAVSERTDFENASKALDEGDDLRREYAVAIGSDTPKKRKRPGESAWSVISKSAELAAYRQSKKNRPSTDTNALGHVIDVSAAPVVTTDSDGVEE